MVQSAFKFNDVILRVVLIIHMSLKVDLKYVDTDVADWLK